MARKQNIRKEEVEEVIDLFCAYRPIDYIVQKTRLSRHSVCRIIQFFYLFDEAGYIK